MTTQRHLTILAGALLMLLGATASHAGAQDIPTTLTDKIYQGSGSINLLTDVDAESLAEYIDENGMLLLAVDVNEASSGTESSLSQGLAIEQLELVITTTTGTFTFSDFYTSTTATLLASGSTVSEEYYTVFGQGGSSSITDSTTDFSIENFDDVIYLGNLSITGTILSADLQVTFLNVADTGRTSSESFFDYSNGPEDFALLDTQTANTLEAANLGVEEAPATVTFTLAPVAPVVAPVQPQSSGAPAPPVLLLALLAGAMAWKARAA